MEISEDVCKTGIFSWEEEYILPEQEAPVAYAMESLECQAIYQQIPKEMDETVVKDYLSRRAKQNQDVYYLAGAPKWGLRSGRKYMKEVVRTVQQWNQKAEAGSGFRGIVWDVEPYLLDEWDEEREPLMRQFTENCKEVYQLAKKEDLYVIVCIPNFYDAAGLDEQLEDLVQSGCDAIAVMNYNKEDEAGQIAVETALAQTYKKGVIHITELQKPGFHELTEQNTYYYDGIDAVRDRMDILKEEYPYKGFGFAWHYLKPALELLEEEK